MVLRRIVVTLVCALSALAVGGCTSPSSSGQLPGARALVDASAANLRKLESVRFEFKVSGAIPGLAVRQVDGVATREGGRYGWAKGDADVQEHTDRRQYDFLLSGDRLRLTDSDGDHVDRTVPERFSPARILDPDRGLYQLLERAENLRTETREELDDVPAYRVTGKLPRDVVSGVIPGIHDDVDVKFWITESSARKLLRMWVQVPPRQKNEGAVMLELALSDHNMRVRPSSANG